MEAEDLNSLLRRYSVLFGRSKEGFGGLGLVKINANLHGGENLTPLYIMRSRRLRNEILENRYDFPLHNISSFP